MRRFGLWYVNGKTHLVHLCDCDDGLDRIARYRCLQQSARIHEALGYDTIEWCPELGESKHRLETLSCGFQLLDSAVDLENPALNFIHPSRRHLRFGHCLVDRLLCEHTRLGSSDRLQALVGKRLQFGLGDGTRQFCFGPAAVRPSGSQSGLGFQQLVTNFRYVDLG